MLLWLLGLFGASEGTSAVRQLLRRTRPESVALAAAVVDAARRSGAMGSGQIDRWLEANWRRDPQLAVLRLSSKLEWANGLAQAARTRCEFGKDKRMSNGEFTFESVTERFAEATAALDTLHTSISALSREPNSIRPRCQTPLPKLRLRTATDDLDAGVHDRDGSTPRWRSCREHWRPPRRFLEGSQVEALRHEVISLQEGIASAQTSAAADSGDAAGGCGTGWTTS